MNNYVIDKDGKWLIVKELKLLIEPSESYLQQRDIEEQQRLEEKLFNSLQPSEKELLVAEIELNIINLLIESEVI